MLSSFDGTIAVVTTNRILKEHLKLTTRTIVTHRSVFPQWKGSDCPWQKLSGS
ncbi:MAG: hypothetical protein JGK01_09455 [Microcoleus sp. PH2017_03_ELD_O_A]|nr:hypothetical protein [Microcoleus sp. PH2017_03_ELD_O_A]